MKKQPSRVKELMNSQLKPFIISPVHVLIISLLFIGTVFVLHLYARFSPGTTSLQMVVAFAVLILSVFASYQLNKRL
ncbi:Sec61 protein translocation complex, beta subunit [Trachipleistophora hominis]|uniref:Sec61 protein translocation complex, beta subunit n=1 Tax=Trachipleistophora hominis TaxID=72359 RepID=L7JV82_TRAHO|nr:Sec61 protein translocation complex, beta subunit [Trachipleistophora hominis]